MSGMSGISSKGSGNSDGRSGNGSSKSGGSGISQGSGSGKSSSSGGGGSSIGSGRSVMGSKGSVTSGGGSSGHGRSSGKGGGSHCGPPACMRRIGIRTISARVRAIFRVLINSLLLVQHGFADKEPWQQRADVQAGGSERPRIREGQGADPYRALRLQQVAPCGGDVTQCDGRNGEAR